MSTGPFPKILHIGDKQIEDLFDGEVEITEKIDGSQFGWGKENGRLFCRSKGRELDMDNPDQMFIDAKRFVAASRGYAHNQWNKFYNFEDVGGNGQHRTAKFAVAFLRVMWQCEQFLLHGEFKCNLEDSDLYPLLKKIKPLSVEEIRPLVPEIVAAMGDMDRRVSAAMADSPYIDMKPDIEWIEDFIYRAYNEERRSK